MNNLEKKSYQLRKDIIKMIYKSGAGHIGGDLSVIDILNVLYNKIMNINPEKIKDPNRDRFILSKGHCADALYVVLGDKGYFNKKNVIEHFSTFGSKFIGHPNMDIPGIEINSGSLGHGLSVATGMAIAGKMDKRNYNVYVVLGDGEMAEGSNYEAMMAASHYKLDNLCATIDLNGLQISGKIKDVMNSEKLADKFKSFGWNVIEVKDGNNCNMLTDAYEKSLKIKNKPSVVIAKTVKGKGISFMENNSKWHHGVMNNQQYIKALNELNEVS
jgi:transketolase